MPQLGAQQEADGSHKLGSIKKKKLFTKKNALRVKEKPRSDVKPAEVGTVGSHSLQRHTGREMDIRRSR